MTRLLDPLRDEDPLPPSTVDIERAVRTGRRQARTRWVGAVVIVVATALLVPVLGWSARGGPPTGPATQPELPIDYPDFDPMRRVVELGDVPDVTPESYLAARRWQRISLSIGESGIGWVTVYAPGRKAMDGLDVLRPDTGIPAEPIGGRPAYWVTPRWEGAQFDELLAWQWAGDAWAFITIQDARAGEGPDRDHMRGIAQAVRVGVGEPVTVPFTLPRPASYQLIGTSTNLGPAGDPFVRTGLHFGVEDPVDPDQYSTYSGLSVAVENGAKMAGHPGANRTVDGRPAMVHEGEAIIFGVVDDFAVDVQGADRPDALLAVARTVRLVPAPDDRATWLAQPLS